MKYLLLLLCSISTIFSFAQQDTVKTTATVSDATVYFGYGAELTHRAKANVTTGTRFIVIDHVSTQIDLNSLQISCPENISLLSQQFLLYTPAGKPVTENPLTLKIRDTIKELGRQVAVIQNKIDIDETVLNKTDKLIESTIATSGSKTALTAEVLKLIDYYNDIITKNKKSIFENRQQVNEIQDKIAAANTRLQLLINNPAEPKEKIVPTGRIIMQVICRNEQQADISLSYYTTSAGWEAIYDLRANSKSNLLKLVYKASVIQSTGINWKKVKLTLSTGTPNFTTTVPVLSAWYLQTFMPGIEQTLNGRASNLTITNTINVFNKREKIVADDKGEYYAKEADAATVVPNTLNDFTKLKQGLLNTNFEIDLPYDIESNGLSHSINIKEVSLQARLKNYGVPKLDADAYLLAELPDWESLDLIPGNANIIMDDTYIGRSFIDPNTTADTLNLSLGKDKRIALKRTLVKDSSYAKTKDAFTKQTFTYELVIKNNKITDADVILKDQYPLSNVKEVEVELTNNGEAAVNTESGVLTWKFSLKPGESKKVRFSYVIKYPKGKRIANLK